MSSKEVNYKKHYTLESHLNLDSNGVQLFQKYKDAILNKYPQLSTKAKKFEMGFLYKDKPVLDISVFKRYIKIWLNVKKGVLTDERGITEDVSQKGHWGSGDYQITVRNEKDFKLVIKLIDKVVQLKVQN